MVSLFNIKNNLGIPINPLNNASGRWRADTYFGSPGSYNFNDLSGNANTMVQVGGTLTPGIAANGQPKMTSVNGRMNSNLLTNNFPVTIFTIGNRNNGAVTGFFSSQTSPSINNLWYGYESSGANNSLYTYLNSSMINPTTDYGSDCCYVNRMGYAGCVQLVNGIIQTASLGAVFNVPMTQTPSSCSIGSTYRLLNMDWYETIVWNRLLSIAEIDYVHNYINLRYSMSIPLFKNYTAVTSFILGGQSNADGRGLRGTGDVNIPSKYENMNTSVFTSNKGAGPGFVNMNLSANQIFNPSYIGPELSLSQDYAALIGKNVYVIKCTMGSTSMTQNPSLTGWGVNGYWSNSHTTNMNDPFSYYNILCNFFWKQLAVLQSSNKTITDSSLRGIVFWQGEDDTVNATAAGQWSSVAQAMFAAMRYEIGFPATKVFVVRININISLSGQPYRDTVRAQQDNCAASLPNCAEVNCDAWGVYDGVHCNYDGQLGVGSLIATLL